MDLAVLIIVVSLIAFGAAFLGVPIGRAYERRRILRPTRKIRGRMPQVVIIDQHIFDKKTF